MKVHATISVAVLAALAGCASAQSVEFRIVEESATTNSTVTALPPQCTPLTAANPTGNYAVQARVTGGAALAGFSFNIVIPGELDSYGTPARLRIQDSTGAYWNGAATTAVSPGYAGIAHQYGSLAAISSDFNGVINTSSGTFTNNPNRQEIGIISGHSAGATMLATPGMDPGGEGNPVTWSGYGQTPIGVPVQNTTVPIPASLAGPYFAQGQFVDIYRFRYTTSFFGARLVNYTLENATAETFSQFIYSAGVWGVQATSLPSTSITVTPIGWGTPAPSTCAAFLGVGALAMRRRRG
jgi:hypothetical protein